MKTFSLFEEYSRYSQYLTSCTHALLGSAALTSSLPFLPFTCKASQLAKYLFLCAKRLHFAATLLNPKCFIIKQLRNSATRYVVCAFLHGSIVNFIKSVVNLFVGAFVELGINFSIGDLQPFFILLTTQRGIIYLNSGLLPHTPTAYPGPRNSLLCKKKSKAGIEMNGKTARLLDEERGKEECRFTVAAQRRQAPWLANPLGQKQRGKL